MNRKVTVIVSSLFLLFSQTSVLSQSSFNDTTLSNTQIAQQSDSDSSSNSSAPKIRRSAGPRFIEPFQKEVYTTGAWEKIRTRASDSKHPFESEIILGFQQYYDQKNLPAALNTFKKLDRLYQESSDQNLLYEQAATKNVIGLIYEDLGELESARDYYTEANRILRTTVTLNNLGSVSLKLEQPEIALDYYHQALTIYSQTEGNNQIILESKLTTLNGIAFLYHVIGNQQKSLNYLEQALTLIRTEEVFIKEKKYIEEGITLNNIGEVYRSLGDKTAAREYYQQALIIFQENNLELAKTTEENIVKLSEKNNIVNNPSSEAITFSCGIVYGVTTTIAISSRGSIPLIKWDSDQLRYDNPQQRCEIVAARLQENYQNGLRYLTTGRKNGQPVICMTSTNDGGCEEFLFTLKPGSDPGEQIQALSNIRTGASGPLNQSTSRVYIDLEEYFDTAAPIQQSEPPTKKENN